MPPKVPKKRPPLQMPKKSTPATAGAVYFDFSVGQKETTDGQRIMIYGPSGRGKSTIASLLRNNIFIPVCDGSKDIRNPETGELVTSLSLPDDQPYTFNAVRAALQSPALDPFQYVTLDHITKVEAISEEYIFEHFTKKDGRAKSLKDYGYGDGFGHLRSTMRLILQDIDALIKRGKTVIVLAQSDDKRVSNPGGDDFLKSCPGLYHDRNNSVMNDYFEEMDYVFRLDYYDMAVSAEKAFGVRKIGKVSGTGTRVFFAADEPHYMAKKRCARHGFPIPDVIGFADQTDNSLWEYLFTGVAPEEEVE